MTDNRNGLTNNDTQTSTGGGGSGGITVESDPIYLADKPNIALKSEVETVQTSVDDLSGNVTTLENKVTDIEGVIPILETNVTDLSTEVNTLSTSVDNLDSNVTALDISVTNMQTTVDDNTNNIILNSDAIADNKLDIDNNTTNISINTSNISDNTSNITINTTDIANNTVNITTNTNNITGLQTKIDDNTTLINTNISNITQNTTDIEGIQNDLSTIQTDVDNNNTIVADLNDTVDTLEIQVNTNTTDITTINSDLTTMNNKITTNATDIDNIEVSLGTLSTSVSTNTDNIGVNTSAINDIENDITTLGADIVMNTNNITQNTTDISALQTDVTNNADEITTIQTILGDTISDVDANTTNISTNRTDINTNTSNISDNTNDIITNADNITSNSNAILTLNDNLESLSDTVDNIESIQEFKDLNDVSIDETITLPTALIMDATGITYNIELFNEKDSVEIENPQALINELTTSQFGLTQLNFTNTLTSDDFIITSNSIELLNNVETISSANINMTVSTEGYSHWMTLVIYKDGVEYTRSNQHYASSSDTVFNFNLVGNSTIKDTGLYTFYVDYSNTDGQGNVTYTVLDTSAINLNIPVTSSGYEIQSQYIPKDEELMVARGSYSTLDLRLDNMTNVIGDNQEKISTITTSITNIQDGTTTVGNADKLDGQDASDFAPSGFGLGGSAEIVTGSANDLLATGFYAGRDLDDAPVPNWMYYDVIGFNNDLYCVQRGFTLLTGPAMYIRNKIQGTFTDWEQIYPAVTSARSMIATQKLMLNGVNYEEADESILENAKEIANDLLLNGNITEEEINEVIKDDIIAEVEFLKIPEWTFGVQYNTQDIVRYEDNKYICIKSHTSQIDCKPDITPTLWNSVKEGSEWQANVFYNVGDIVEYQGVEYKCIQLHTSQSNYYPTIATVLWQVI